MTSPADTIREALEWLPITALRGHARREAALAALTELEADRDRWKENAEVAQAAADSAEADRDRLQADVDMYRREVAEVTGQWQTLRDALEWMANYKLTGTEQTLHIDMQGRARAALATPDTPPDA